MKRTYHLTLALAFTLLSSVGQAAPTHDATEKAAVEIVNNTEHPLNVFQGKTTVVVQPKERLQAEGFTTAPLTITTKTPEAAIRFVTLSNARGCSAPLCLLITGK
ncbi:MULTISPECIES: hypothetical protein [unclassified Pseudomonas]|uniref:hypothetical protein n=1 Tax=unclassified Pseudomonas TaxID=196821 RepID=UPI0015A4CB34|nr:MULTISPECIES: hypothetical protein [unclassified Pseudomonas]NWC94147.1 hypothetical protein [Pseudomonas sp. IPO3779]NWD20887.1 hypothetical protein [Pseudomonas sp. IPO3778]